MTSITIEGITYYSQYRKCGRPGCHCEHDQGHGPYWYARNLSTGKRSYVGKELPSHIKATVRAWREHEHELTTTINQLHQDLHSLTKLRHHEPLNQTDCDRIARYHLQTLLLPAQQLQLLQDPTKETRP